MSSAFNEREVRERECSVWMRSFGVRCERMRCQISEERTVNDVVGICDGIGAGLGWVVGTESPSLACFVFVIAGCQPSASGMLDFTGRVTLCHSDT